MEVIHLQENIKQEDQKKNNTLKGNYNKEEKDDIMEIMLFKKENNGSFDEENDTIEIRNDSNELNQYDERIIKKELRGCKLKPIKLVDPDMLVQPGLKVPKSRHRSRKILNKPRHYNYSNESRKGGEVEKFRILNASNASSNFSDYTQEHIKENNLRLVPLSGTNNRNNVIVPYQKVNEIYRFIEDQKSHKYRNFFMYSPDILQKWIRLIFNVIITSLIITLIYFIFISVREDIHKKIAIQKQNLKADSMSCRKQYEAHKCATVTLPLLIEKCEEWMKCMKTDSNLYQDISFLSAQMLGQIINAFIVQFEWKSIAVIAFIFLLIFIGSNYALSIGGGNRYTSDYQYLTPPIPSYPVYPNYPFVPNMLNPSTQFPYIPYPNMPPQDPYMGGEFSHNAFPGSYNQRNFYDDESETNGLRTNHKNSGGFEEAFAAFKKENSTPKKSKRFKFLEFFNSSKPKKN